MKTPDRRSIVAIPLSIDEEARTIEYVASDESVDSYDTILRQDWDLSRFDGGGPLLFNHDPCCIIGGAQVRIEGKRLIAKVQFARDVQEPEEKWQLAKQGFLKGISVRFRAGKATETLIDGKPVVVFEKLELIELSLTPIPSNKNALARSDEPTDSPLGRAQHLEKEMPDENKGAQQKPEDTLKRADHEAVVSALNATISTRDARIAELERSHQETVRTLEARKAELEGKLATFENARKERKLDDLEGKKFSKGERAVYAQLLNQNEALFDQLVGARADLPTDKQVIPPEGPGSRAVVGQGDVTIAEINRLVAAKVKDGIEWSEAQRMVAAERPELFR